MLGRCTVCGQETELACSDCQIVLNTTVYVCKELRCRNAHDRKCPHKLKLLLEERQRQSETEPLSTLLLTCAQKHQFLDDCQVPDCGHRHTRQAIWEVGLQNLDKSHLINRLTFSCFLENDALPYQVGREYVLTIRERV